MKRSSLARKARHPARHRTPYLFLAFITTLAGLASRKYGGYLPTFISAYAGDALWAMLVFWLIRIAFSRKPSWWVASRALVFAFAIEVSQLYHAPWLDWLRSTTLGSLVLGHGFL
ncbi:ribosomal maturation YjgA family protein [Hymenobacter crusticola]|uniref:ribosomal maturation YjgA family protein n=1 Tax=Hymenobacter crusticola TaxID=1770526 RepID=UPI001C4F33D4